MNPFDWKMKWFCIVIETDIHSHTHTRLHRWTATTHEYANHLYFLFLKISCKCICLSIRMRILYCHALKCTTEKIRATLSLFHTHFSYLAIKMYEDDPAASYTAYYQCDMLYLALIILITALLIKMAIHKPHTDRFTIQPTEREWGVEGQVGSFHFCGLLGCHKNKSFLLPFSFSSA